MPWCVGQHEGVNITCSVVNYDIPSCRQRKHYAIGQVKCAFAKTFLFPVAAGGEAFKEHRAEAHREYWLHSQWIHAEPTH